MKLIFLDFDGVINSFGGEWQGEYEELDKKCIENLNLLIEKVEDIKIVISSTWRIIRSLDRLKDIMVKWGFKYPEIIIDKTPRLAGQRRGIEIYEWKLYSKYRNIDNFIILDDDSDMEPFMNHLIQTDTDKGLTIEDVNKAVQFLNGERLNEAFR
jgi:hypothetical protein